MNCHFCNQTDGPFIDRQIGQLTVHECLRCANRRYWIAITQPASALLLGSLLFFLLLDAIFANDSISPRDSAVLRRSYKPAPAGSTPAPGTISLGSLGLPCHWRPYLKKPSNWQRSAGDARRGAKHFEGLRAWKRDGCPLPCHPVSHTRDGRLRTETANAWGSK